VRLEDLRRTDDLNRSAISEIMGYSFGGSLAPREFSWPEGATTTDQSQLMRYIVGMFAQEPPDRFLVVFGKRSAAGVVDAGLSALIVLGIGWQLT
jgi:hypothetical protein